MLTHYSLPAKIEQIRDMNNTLLTQLRTMPPDQQREFAPQVQAIVERGERSIKRLVQLHDYSPINTPS